MIKNHQNFKENNKTATFVENVSSNKFTQPRDREARPRRQNGQVSKNHFNTASQGGWRKKKPVQLRFQGNLMEASKETSDFYKK